MKIAAVLMLLIVLVAAITAAWWLYDQVEMETGAAIDPAFYQTRFAVMTKLTRGNQPYPDFRDLSEFGRPRTKYTDTRYFLELMREEDRVNYFFEVPQEVYQRLSLHEIIPGSQVRAWPKVALPEHPPIPDTRLPEAAEEADPAPLDSISEAIRGFLTPPKPAED